MKNAILLSVFLFTLLTAPIRSEEVQAVAKAGQVAFVKYRAVDPPKPPEPKPKDDAPTVALPKTLTEQPNRYFKLTATTNCPNLKWIVPKELDQFPAGLLKDPNVLLLIGGEGTYTVQAYGAKGDVASDIATCTITIGTPPPPTPPTPPVPPMPPPSPAPIPDAGFRVLITVAKADLSDLPPAQSLALRAGSVRTFLNANCIAGDGGQKEWRIWSKDSDVTNETPLWQKAFKRPRKGLPSILISNGTTGFEGTLPADTDSLLALLAKYAPRGGK